MSATPFCIAAAKELAKSRAPASVWKDLEQDANDEGRRAGCEVHLKKNRDGIEWHAKVALVDEDAEGIESRYAICVLQKVDCRGDERPKLLLSKHMPKCEAKRVEIEDAKEKIKELEEKLENTEAKREKEKSEYDAKAERDKVGVVAGGGSFFMTALVVFVRYWVFFWRMQWALDVLGGFHDGQT